MINFEGLVNEFLLENDTAVNTPVTDPAANDPTKLSDADVASLQAYVKSNEVYKKLQTIHDAQYDRTQLHPFPSADELAQIAITVANNSLRNVKSSSAFPKIKSLYHLLDLFAQLAVVFKRNSGLNSQARTKESQTLIQQFETTVGNSSSTPLDYSAVTGWAQTVKQDYYSEEKGQIGKLRLESLPKEFSFYGTIKHLLSLRSQFKEKSIPLEKIPDPEKYIADIFLSPNSYKDGQAAVPSDKRLQELYDETTSNELVRVSMAAYGLFKQQAISNVGVDDENKIRITNEQEAYALYLGSNTDRAMPFNWSNFKLEESTFNFTKQINKLAVLLKEYQTKAPYEAQSGKSYLFDFNQYTNNFEILDADTKKVIKELTEEQIVKIVSKYKEGQEGNEPINGTVLMQHLNQLSSNSDVLKKSAEATAANILADLGLEPKPTSDTDSQGQKPFETAVGSGEFLYD